MADDVSQFIADLLLDVEREAIGSEMAALQAIYGEESLKSWQESDSVGSHQDAGSIRYQVTVKLPNHDAITARCLVSLPLSYPESSPPQLQLLSKYVGDFQVDSPLFGSVLRTFHSSEGAQWSSGQACVFDGLESVISLCTTWYDDRLSEKAAAATHRDEVLKSRLIQPQSKPQAHVTTHWDPASLEGIEIYEAEPIVDRKSIFIGRACHISDPAQVHPVLSTLMLDHRIAKAAHPIINAWRCEVNDVIHADNDDNGETAAGGRLAYLLQILDVDDVLVVVTRYFGGIHLGPDRFKHINQAARNALEKGGFLDAEEKQVGSREKKRIQSRNKHKN